MLSNLYSNRDCSVIAYSAPMIYNIVIPRKKTLIKNFIVPPIEVSTIPPDASTKTDSHTPRL